MRAGRTFPSKVRRFGARLPDLVLFDGDTAVGADGAESSVATLTDTDVGSGTEDHVVGPTEGDTGAGTDIDTLLAQGNPQDDQPATGTDDAVVGLTESDTGAGTDAGEIRGWVLVASDAAPISDAVTWTRRLSRAASDAVSLTSEVATSARTTFATAVDSVTGVSDAVVRQRIVPRSPSETLTTAEVIVLHVFFANRVVQEPFGYAPTVLADGPAGYWRLGETSGDAARDASVHTLDGAYKQLGLGAYTLGQTGLLVGDFNTAVQFDGSLDDYALFSDTDASGYVVTPSAHVSTTSPPVTGYRGWWDASDTASITDAGGGAVSQWNDKSGNGLHLLQGVGANRPLTGTRTVNGLNVLDFDGANDYLARAATQAVNATDGTFTVIALAVPDTIAGTQGIVDQDTGTRVAQFLRQNGVVPQSIGFNVGAGGPFTDSPGPPVVPGSPYVMASVRTTTTLEAFFNGYSDGSTATPGSAPNNAATELDVGTGFGATNPFNGRMAEVLVYQRALTSLERQAVEAYLMAKWMPMAITSDIDIRSRILPTIDKHLRLDGVSGTRVATPDSVPLSITGDIDIKVKCSLDDWTPAVTNNLIAKLTFTTQQSYIFEVLSSGALYFYWSPDGTSPSALDAQTPAPGFADGSTHWVRVTMKANDGAGNRIIKFYISNDTTDNPDAVVWTQTGSTITTAGVTSIFDSSTELAVGGYSNGAGGPPTGNFYAAQIKNGYDGAGSVVASPVFRTSLPYTDAQGNVWTAFVDALINLFPHGVDGSQQIVSKWQGEGAYSYELALLTNGCLSFAWCPDGAGINASSMTSTVLVPGIASGQPKWVRATFKPDDGVGNHVTKFYGSDDGVTWTQVGSTVTVIGVSSIFDSTAPVWVGNNIFGLAFHGKIYSAEVRKGIDGTVVASPKFYGSPKFTDAQSNTWTFGNTAVRVAGGPSRAWLQIAHDPGFQISTTGKLSVNFWLKASSFSGEDLIYKSSARVAGTKEWAIGELGENLGLYAKIYASDGSVLAQAVASGGGFNVTGTRYHIVMVWDGFNLKLYSNGAVIASGTGVGNPASTFGPVWVGSSGIAVYDEISITGINFSLGQVRARFEAGMQPSTFDTLTRSQVLARAVSDSCTTSESLQALRIKPRTSSDTISAATDVLDRVYLAIRATSDAVSGTDIGRRLYSRVNFEIATAIDHAVPVGIHPRTGTDAVATATDAVVTLRTRSGITADTISVSETAAVTQSILARIVPDSLTLTEAITRSNGIFSRTASDTVHIGIDWAVDNFSVHVRAVAESNSVSDVATGDRLRTRSVSDNVSGLSDAVVRAPFRPRAGAEVLPALTDKITRHFVGARIVTGVITVVDTASRKIVDKRGPSDALTALSEAPSKLCVHTRHAMELLYESFADGVDHAAGAPFHLPTFGPPLVTITSMTPKVSLVVPYNVVTVTVTFDRYVQAWVVRVGGHTPWEGSLVAQWSGAPRLSDSIQVDSAHLEGGRNDIRVYAQAVSGDWSGIKS